MAIVLLACFAKPLYELVRFALHSDLFSHVLLIPFISGYLVWIRKASLPPPSRPARGLGIILLVLGVLAYFGAALPLVVGLPTARYDHLTWSTLSLVLLFGAACCFCFGPATLRAISFPLAFLLFAVPFPGIVVAVIERFLQVASALAADLFFTVTGMNFVRQGLVLQLPGISLEVAPECSGIHSTLVLFITSFVAGQLFLHKFSNRMLLAVAVIPLGILRNGFRIWTLGELCVHVNPNMIDSPIHHHGGPLFFAVSLIPLFLLLLYQRRSELKTKAQTR